MQKIQREKQKADLVFEISWEVCNKVGGIFTVLSSKARQMKNIYGDKYLLVGPYFNDSSKKTFNEEPIPENYKAVYNELKDKGIIFHYGSWLVEGEPKVILVDYGNYWPQINMIKREMWDSFELDSMNSPYDFDEPVLWSWSVGILIDRLSKVHSGMKILAQAHEWLSGGAVLYLKKNNVNVSTVFTTHATTLGRTLAGHGIDLYSVIDKIDPKAEAYKYGIIAKYSIEKIAAQISDVFTTVSQITALEAKHILGREADLILPNGLDMSKFPSFEETTIKHKLFRNKLREFALYYFFPYYDFDLKETLFFFTASRYEFHNKGLDIFIESLGRLNEKMKKNKSSKTVVAFFWVPARTNGIKQEIIESREAFNDIKDLLEENEDDINDNFLYAITSQSKICEKTIFNGDFSLDIKKKVKLFRSRSGNAPLSTHELPDFENDPIIRAFRSARLENKEEDKVKVIFYPIYLTGADGLCELDYYQSIQACHFGAFPSYYEPWGYTPLETAALGVSALTSNLSGFGKYFFEVLKDKKDPGVYILDIENKEKEEVVNNFTDILYKYTFFDKKERIDDKIQAREVAFMADWENFVNNYIQAHNLAIERRGA